MEYKDVNSRYLIIMSGIRSKNISKTCEVFGISRPTYYKWYKKYKENGIENLGNKVKSKPKMPNKVPKEVEELILDYVIETPKYGPRRISNDLKKINIQVGEMGVYNVLKRNNLNLMRDRIKYAKKYSYVPRNKSPKTFLSLETIQNSYPGYVLQQGTSYIGEFNRIGRVYMITIVDCYSNFTIAKIYRNRKFENVKNIIETKLIPIAKSFNIKINNIITNKSSEYYSNWGKDKHEYYTLLSNYNIKQIIIPANENSNINFLKNTNNAIYKEFYKSILENNFCTSFDELEGKLQYFLSYYNLKRRIKSGEYKGKTPIEIFTNKLNGKYQIPTWFFVNSVKY